MAPTCRDDLHATTQTSAYGVLKTDVITVGVWGKGQCQPSGCFPFGNNQWADVGTFLEKTMDSNLALSICCAVMAVCHLVMALTVVLSLRQFEAYLKSAIPQNRECQTKRSRQEKGHTYSKRFRQD